MQLGQDPMQSPSTVIGSRVYSIKTRRVLSLQAVRRWRQVMAAFNAPLLLFRSEQQTHARHKHHGTTERSLPVLSLAWLAAVSHSMHQHCAKATIVYSKDPSVSGIAVMAGPTRSADLVDNCFLDDSSEQIYCFCDRT